MDTLLPAVTLLFYLRFSYFCYHFLCTVLVKRHNPLKSSKKFYLHQSTNQEDRQVIKGINVP